MTLCKHAATSDRFAEEREAHWLEQQARQRWEAEWRRRAAAWRRLMADSDGGCPCSCFLVNDQPVPARTQVERAAIWSLWHLLCDVARALPEGQGFECHGDRVRLRYDATASVLDITRVRGRHRGRLSVRPDKRRRAVREALQDAQDLLLELKGTPRLGGKPGLGVESGSHERQGASPTTKCERT
jgi:hypothetical protein